MDGLQNIFGSYVVDRVRFLSRIKRLAKVDDVKKLKGKKKENDKKNRSVLISVNDIGKRFLIHNGNKYVSLFVRPFMLGYKFGSFVLTKRKMYSIHVSKDSKGKVKVKGKAGVSGIKGKGKS